MLVWSKTTIERKYPTRFLWMIKSLTTIKTFSWAVVVAAQLEYARLLVYSLKERVRVAVSLIVCIGGFDPTPVLTVNLNKDDWFGVCLPTSSIGILSRVPLVLARSSHWRGVNISVEEFASAGFCGDLPLLFWSPFHLVRVMAHFPFYGGNAQKLGNITIVHKRLQKLSLSWCNGNTKVGVFPFFCYLINDRIKGTIKCLWHGKSIPPNPIKLSFTQENPINKPGTCDYSHTWN